MWKSSQVQPGVAMDEGILADGVLRTAKVEIDSQGIGIRLQPACGKPDNLSLICQRGSRPQPDAVNVFSIQLNIERRVRALGHASISELQKQRHRLTRLQEQIRWYAKINIDQSRTLQFKPVRRGVRTDRRRPIDAKPTRGSVFLA